MFAEAESGADGFFDPNEIKQVEVRVDGRHYLVELPQWYWDLSFMMALFPAPLRRVRELLPSDRLTPVQLIPGIAMVALTAFEHRRTASLAPYNEFAIMVPVRCRPAVNIPALPLLFPSLFKDLGFYIYRLPVTTQEACDIGIKLWGLPKTVAVIIFEDLNGMRRCRWRDGTEDIISLEAKIPKARARGKGMRRRNFVTYSMKDNQLLRAEIQTRGRYSQWICGASYALGNHPVAGKLRALGMWKTAVLRLSAAEAEGKLYRGEAV